MEVWKDIQGYEGLYQVSDMGRVKSLNYRHTGTERVLKAVRDKDGYFFVDLYKDGKGKSHKVHRLVAATFLSNPLSLPQCNHKDENPSNNRVENLEWCTQAYNINYGTRNEKVAKVFSKSVLQYTLDGELVREWKSTHEAGRCGFNQGRISACCRKVYGCKTYKGYIWRYKEAV